MSWLRLSIVLEWVDERHAAQCCVSSIECGQLECRVFLSDVLTLTLQAAGRVIEARWSAGMAWDRGMVVVSVSAKDRLAEKVGGGLAKLVGVSAFVRPTI